LSLEETPIRKEGDMPSPDWDERYRTGFYDGVKDPHDLLVNFGGLFTGKRVLDIAMGRGADALYLASHGIKAVGLERSWEAIKLAEEAMKVRNCPMSIVQADASRLPFKKGSFGGIIVFFFLLREIARDITEMLKPGGILIYETFLKRQNEVDRPRNPAFLLDDGELLSLFPGFTTIFYEEGAHDRAGKKRITAQLVARKT
jgi:tellurite methyltransferase